MITSPGFYPDNDSISIVYDKEDFYEARLLRAFRDSFGDAYAVPEDLDVQRCCLHLRRGGLQEVKR